MTIGHGDGGRDCHGGRDHGGFGRDHNGCGVSWEGGDRGSDCRGEVHRSWLKSWFNYEGGGCNTKHGGGGDRGSDIALKVENMVALSRTALRNFNQSTNQGRKKKKNAMWNIQAKFLPKWVRNNDFSPFNQINQPPNHPTTS